MTSSRKLLLFAIATLGAVVAWCVCATPALAQSMPNIQVSMHPADGPEQVVPALKMLGMLTILSVAPAILISMTSFTRIVVVLSFVRQAIGSQNVPPMQIILALSLLFTAVVMAPTAHRIDQEALSPYMAEEIDEAALYERSSGVMKDFLLPQTREDDLALFYDMSGMDRPDAASEVSLLMLVPAFMISELRTGFEMGFLLFLPFVLVDLIVASILTSMGMVMLPPTMLSTPLKLLLFVVVDGWSLITHSLITSFQ